MSLFGSLYTGAAGMMAQSLSTAVISENIANVTTTGYKRSDAAFFDLVTDNKSSVSQSGSVTSDRVLRADIQGGLVQTSSGLDAAISGNGFFVVRRDIVNPDAQVLYTRNGTFNPDANGILRNSAGFALYGWPVDANGVVQVTDSVDSLVPIDIDVFQTTALPTTRGEIVLNLDANQEDYDPHILSPAQQLPVSAQAPHFVRSLPVFDTNGGEHAVTFEYRKIVGPMAHFTSNAGVLDRTDVLVNPLGPTPGILAGDTLDITGGAAPLTIDFVAGTADTSINEANTLQDVIDVINDFDGGVPGGPQIYTATLSPQGRLLVQANDPTITLDIGASSATVLGATGLNFIPDPDGPDFTYEPDADLLVDGVANPNQTDFPAFANTTDPNVYNWWEVTLLIPDPTIPGGTGPLTELRKGLINFDSNGQLNATPDANGEIIIDLETVPIDFDIADATEDIGVTVDISGFTQFAGNFDVRLSDQNGAGLGTFTGVEILSDGTVLSVFSNGLKQEAFGIPLATFTNVNGLERISGTAFAETQNSGTVTLNQTNTGGAGNLQVSNLENSNVDLANEFSLLIVSQRAFSLNGQLINAVNEMTQQLAQLKR